MRKLLIVLGLVVFGAVAALPAAAHVHGITPLRDCTVDNPNSGALVADDHSDQIFGLIPRDVGEAPLTAGDGGFGATAGHCP